MSTYQPYFYVICWPKLNWYYAGVQYARTKPRCANPSNLFRKDEGFRYTTSSKLVKRFSRWFGDPEISEVIPFPTAQAAIDFEVEFLSLLNLSKEGNVWLNRNVAGAIKCPDAGLRYSEAHRRKMSEAARKRPKPSEDTRRKISAGKTGKSPSFRKPHSEETKRKIGLANAGKSPTEETRNRLSQALKGKKAWNEGKVCYTPEQVEIIRSAPATVTNVELCKQLNLGRETVGRIRRNSSG